MPYKQTDLWRNAFNSKKNDESSEQKNRLAVEYAKFWEKAAKLASQISSDLPNLTLHDKEHFTALWQRADLIAGSNYDLNPLETFIFGGAILLHDAGHAIRAYQGGLDEIRQTPQWHDNLEAVRQQIEGNALAEQGILDSFKTVEDKVLFDTLRELHAELAESLGTLTLKNSGTESVSHLIEDDTIRTHLGKLIGQIGASHHWSIEEIEHKFKKIQGGIAGFPWTVDPIKIACLLRCADAVQIDQSRAPDFSYALLRLKGLSEQHWRAQNRLSAPLVDRNDSPEALIFTSTNAFGPDDADAWWVAYDAITMANRELQNCYRLLTDLKKPSFAIKRIKDADSPERLAEHVETRNWRPVAVQVKVGKVERLIEMFGGAQLYGNDNSVPLREMIQNAADAIRARRALEPGFKGRVTVRLEKTQHDGAEGYWLEVEDDGIGMSERRLTGPLLEFGTSYWSSDLIKTEFPGLRGRKLQQTGRYGIGFYSIFMISDHVTVSSRSYDAGLPDIRSLLFRKGVYMRPLLLEGAKPAMSMAISTRVRAFVAEEVVKGLLEYKEELSEKTIHILTPDELIANLCPTVDCDVYAQTDKMDILSHDMNWQNNLLLWFSKTLWLGRRNKEHDYVNKYMHMMQKIGEDAYGGCAAICFESSKVGLKSIGGFARKSADFGPNSWGTTYMGVLQVQPEGPNRTGHKLVARNSDMTKWANDQAKIIEKIHLSPAEFATAASNVHFFGGDPTSILRMHNFNNDLNINCIFNLLEQNILYSPVAFIGSAIVSEMSVSSDDGEIVINKNNSELIANIIIKYSYDIYSYSPFYFIDADNDDRNIIGCIERYCASKGRKLVKKHIKNFKFGTYTGPSSELEGIKTGQPIIQDALELSLEPIGEEAPEGSA